MKQSELGKIVKSCSYTTGQVYVSDMKNNMWAVVAISKDKVVASRNFAYTDTTKKVVWKRCNAYYKKVKECFFQRKLEKIEELED